jgi:hypothetical protein
VVGWTPTLLMPLGTDHCIAMDAGASMLNDTMQSSQGPYGFRRPARQLAALDWLCTCQLMTATCWARRLVPAGFTSHALHLLAHTVSCWHVRHVLVWTWTGHVCAHPPSMYLSVLVAPSGWVATELVGIWDMQAVWHTSDRASARQPRRYKSCLPRTAHINYANCRCNYTSP